MKVSKNLLITYSNSLIYKIPKYIENVAIQNDKIILSCSSAHIDFVFFIF